MVESKLRNCFESKRKLALVLQCKSLTSTAIRTRDMVEIYLETTLRKHRLWSSSRIVLEYEGISHILTATGTNWRKEKGSCSRFSYSYQEDFFANSVSEPNGVFQIIFWINSLTIQKLMKPHLCSQTQTYLINMLLGIKTFILVMPMTKQPSFPQSLWKLKYSALLKISIIQE